MWFKDNYKELFRVMRWGLDATNGFFRTIYCGKLWLSRSEAIRAVEHGWNMLEPNLQKLYYI